MDRGDDKLNFEKGGGLIPTVVVDRKSGKILMLAFSSLESLEKTFKTGFAHFYSRERDKIWKKGEESGNTMRVFRIFSDCDLDSLIFFVEPAGPACHTNESSCFFYEVKNFDMGKAELMRSDFDGGIIYEIEKILRQRKKEMDEGVDRQGSYTAELFRAGLTRIISKIMEEAGELCEASIRREKENDPVCVAKTDEDFGKKDSVVWEAADLLFHIIALFVYLGIPFDDVLKELMRRRRSKVEGV